MDLNLDPHDQQNRPLQDCAEHSCAAAASRPDWHGLRARLVAGYAARRSIEEGIRMSRAPGSFDRASARAIANLAETRSVAFTHVNPICLSDGKAGVDIVPAAAGETRTGDRG